MKELKTQKTLTSFDGMERAVARPGLYNNVLQNAGKGVIKQLPVNKIVFLRAAACIILLAGINVFTVIHHNKSRRPAPGNNAFANEYFSY